MKIDKFIKKVNQNDRMYAETVDGVVAIYDDSEHEVLDIACDATNWLDINYFINSFGSCFGKASREYLSALIEELLHTPIEKRFPEKKYYLRWITDDDGTPNYLHNVDGTWDWSSTKVGTKVFTKEELQHLKINNPKLAPAIDAMKEPVEDNKI